MTMERRNCLRINIPGSIANCKLLTLKSRESRFAVWPVENISAVGVAVKSTEKVVPGSLAFLNIDLDVLMKTVGVVGKIVWTRESENGYETGISFSCWPNKKDEGFLQQFVNGKISSGDRRKTGIRFNNIG